MLSERQMKINLAEGFVCVGGEGAQSVLERSRNIDAELVFLPT